MHRRRHHGAQRGTCPPTFDLSWARGAQITDINHASVAQPVHTSCLVCTGCYSRCIVFLFDTLVNWALGSHLANKDMVMQPIKLEVTELFNFDGCAPNSIKNWVGTTEKWGAPK